MVNVQGEVELLDVGVEYTIGAKSSYLEMRRGKLFVKMKS